MNIRAKDIRRIRRLLDILILILLGVIGYILTHPFFLIISTPQKLTFKNELSWSDLLNVLMAFWVSLFLTQKISHIVAKKEGSKELLTEACAEIQGYLHEIVVLVNQNLRSPEIIQNQLLPYIDKIDILFFRLKEYWVEELKMDFRSLSLRHTKFRGAATDDLRNTNFPILIESYRDNVSSERILFDRELWNTKFEINSK